MYKKVKRKSVMIVKFRPITLLNSAAMTLTKKFSMLEFYYYAFYGQPIRLRDILMLQFGAITYIYNQQQKSQKLFIIVNHRNCLLFVNIEILSYCEYTDYEELQD